MVAINITTFSNHQDTVFREILTWLSNDNVCSHLTNVIKTSITIVSINIKTFLNTQDTVFCKILSLLI